MNYLNRTEYKNMKIWHTSNFIAMVSLTILCIVFAILLFLCIYFDSDSSKKLFALFIIEISCLLLLVYFINLTVKEMRRNNNLTQNGIIVKGVIESVSEILEGFEVKVVYYNKEIEKKYIYKQSKHSSYNFNWLKQQILLNPEIDIVIDEKHNEIALVLLDDWLKNLGINKSCFDYPKVSELDDIVNERLKRIQGKLVRKSLNVWGRNGVLGIVEADVIYYDIENSKSMLFKGRGYVKWGAYLKARQVKDDIIVDVVYDINNSNNCVVYLEEALEKL